MPRVFAHALSSTVSLCYSPPRATALTNLIGPTPHAAPSRRQEVCSHTRGPPLPASAAALHLASRGSPPPRTIGATPQILELVQRRKRPSSPPPNEIARGLEVESAHETIRMDLKSVAEPTVNPDVLHCRRCDVVRDILQQRFATQLHHLSETPPRRRVRLVKAPLPSAQVRLSRPRPSRQFRQRPTATQPRNPQPSHLLLQR